jgi:predicted nucleic acid-binding protein
LIWPNAEVLRDAAEVEPLSLRSLDAVHLATALSLQPELAGMIVYDHRLAAAARAAGLTVWAPA